MFEGKMLVFSRYIAQKAMQSYLTKLALFLGTGDEPFVSPYLIEVEFNILMLWFTNIKSQVLVICKFDGVDDGNV